MLKMSKSFAVRMTLWSVLVLYLVCDFFLFSGPLKRELRRMFPTREDKVAEAISQEICARVYNAPIYLGQVERRVQERLWRTGRDAGRVGGSEMEMLRWLALDELIAEALLRIKVRVNIEQARVSTAAVDAELARFMSRFDSPEELSVALAAQGIAGREELRLRIQARLEQEKYVLSKIRASIAISEDQARGWYNRNQDELTTPECRQVRHIFLATLNRPSATAKESLMVHLAAIQAGQADFAEVAAMISEDERSKLLGGELGWMRKDRLADEFAAHAFSISANTPSLVGTKLGWHIIEVTGIRPAELLPYEMMRDEIIAALSDQRRKQALDEYRHQLRLLNHEQVEIYREVLKIPEAGDAG